ncbi:MAG: transcription antitermination factor NusB [Microcystaceae cyanobacterium]|nr:transcription antitermination factor NusB [Merismopediaceae bacterium]
MPPRSSSNRQQPRRIARELALLSLSQLKNEATALDPEEINPLLLAAIRTLTSEAQENLATAAEEIHRSQERLLSQELRSTALDSAQAMVQESMKLTQSAINRVAIALDLPEMVQMANQYEVRDYAITIISTVQRRRQEIDQQLETAMVDWQLKRLPRIDQDILRLALAEMCFLDIPQKIAINEAVELAKRYSDEEGYRFINGVLRRVSNQLAPS